MPKASLLVAMSTPLTVSDDLCRSLPPICLFARLHAPCLRPACPALRGPHASQLAASDLARVGARACACARAACSPALGRGLCPFRSDFQPAVRARAFPACPTACSPSRLSLLSGAARSTPPPPAIQLSSCRLQTPNCRRRPAIQPAPAPPSVAAFPLCAPAKSGALGCSTGAAVSTIPLRFHLRFGVGTAHRFFSRFRGDLASSGPSEI
jgi:hypothetical protein